MPRELKEINNFNRGIILNASEKDTPEDAATFSLNVNPIAEHGILDAINIDRFIIDSNEATTDIAECTSWGANTNKITEAPGRSGNYNHNNIQLENIDVFKDRTHVEMTFIGTKGRKETLLATEVEPRWEELLITSTQPVEFEPQVDFNPEDEYITYLTDTNTITLHNTSDDSTATITGFAVTGFSDAEATLTATGTTLSNYVDKYMKILTPDGEEIKYRFYNDSSGDSGTEDGAYVRVQLNGETTIAGIIDEIEVALAHDNGHGGKITMSQSTGILTLTYAQKPLSAYVYEGDYISFATGASFTGRVAYEILKVRKVDITNYRIYFDRNMFGSITGFGAGTIKLTAGTLYKIYAGRETIRAAETSPHQTISKKCTCKLNGWSKWSGNNIGGNSNYNIVADPNDTEEKEYLGKIITDTGTNTVVFSNSAKTVTFGAGVGISGVMNFKEGDIVTFYGSSNYAAGYRNNGFTAEIVSKTDNPTVWTLDKAPEDDTAAGTLYIESNLIKNHSFHHSVDAKYINNKTESSAVTVRAGQVYTVNDWQHIKQTYEPCTNEYEEASNSFILHDEDGGGLFEDLNSIYAADVATKYYPFEENDRFIKIQSAFNSLSVDASTPPRLAIDCNASTSKLIADESINSYLAKDDIIKIGNEYMKVLLVDGNIFYVVRGIGGYHAGSTNNTVATAHSDGDRIYKNIQRAIRQNIDKNRLTPGKSYTLTLFAKSEVSDENYYPAIGNISLRINGGYFESTGIWKEASIDKKDGYHIETATDDSSLLGGTSATDTIEVMQESRWINFKELESENYVPGQDDATGAGTHGGLDKVWRKIHFDFTLPSKTELISDLVLEISSKGIAGSWLYIDQVLLREKTEIHALHHNDSSINSMHLLDNSGNKELIIYDDMKKSLSYFKDFNAYATNSVPAQITNLSSSASSYITSSNNSVSMVSNNRELHIGFGGKSSDTAPQWLGYINHKLFGKDYTDEIYQDEDTVERYSSETNMSSFDKVCVAGEFEYLASYWNNSGGSINDASIQGDTLALADNSLRIIHTSHDMNTGDNIVIREWADASNSWDGSGVWVITNSTASENFFDCKRLNSKDADPAEEGIFSITDIDGSSGTATVTCDAHGMITGDKVLIYGSHAEYNTTSGHTITKVNDTSFTFSSASTQVNQTGTGIKQLRLCYRPYYYYTIKDGEPFLYRITPETRIADGSGTPAISASEVYTQGKIEKSQPLSLPITSITTCYNKKTDGTGGGRIYGLSANSEEVIVIDTRIKYDEWETASLSEDCKIELEFKSYKWSNDSTTGDWTDVMIDGTKEVLPGSGLASESSPTIQYAGVLSDIVETKGPTSDLTNLFTIDATSKNTNTPQNFDTRLWVQSRPWSASDSFSEGSRFLFCGKTEDGNTDSGSELLYMADRTPATTLMPTSQTCFDYENGWSVYEGGPGPMGAGNPGVWRDDASGAWHWAYWGAGWRYMWHKPYYNIEKLHIRTGRHYGSYAGDFANAYGTSGEHAQFHTKYQSPPFINFGENIGWYSNRAKITNGEKPAFKVAKYGLFTVGDNDKDGLLDGTGVIVPSNKSLISIAGGAASTHKSGPYGRLHQRVSSHAVGLIGSSDTNWIRYMGKLTGHFKPQKYLKGNAWGHWHTDLPEFMTANQFIWVCTDMHFGDTRFKKDSYAFSAMSDPSSGGGDAGDDNEAEKTDITLTTTADIHEFQAGDVIYVNTFTSGEDGWDAGQGRALIDRIDYDNGKLRVALDYPGNIGAGSLYPRAIHLYNNGAGTGTANTNKGPIIGHSQHLWHFAYDDEDPNNGSIFTEASETFKAIGHMTRHWYSPATTIGQWNTDNVQERPGYVFPFDKLNFRAGFLLRPFIMEDDDFNDLIIGAGTYVDLPSAPDAVYHVKNDAVTPNYLHYSVNDDAVNNQFASRLFISSPKQSEEAEEDKSKIYICDLNFMYPSDSLHINSSSVAGGAGTIDSRNTAPIWDVWLAGPVANYFTVFDASDASNKAASRYFSNVTDCPVLEIDAGKTAALLKTDTTGGSYPFNGNSIHRKENAIAGMCISVLDQVTGTIQTRQIIASKTDLDVGFSNGGTGNHETHMLIQVHYPFGHAPVAGDTWYIWEHALVCTAPVRLLKEKVLSHGIGTAHTKDPILLGSPAFQKEATFTDLTVSSNVATVTTGAAGTTHGLTVNDIIMIKNTNVDALNSTFKITGVPRPYTFTFDVSTDDVSGELGSWELAPDSEATTANPLTIDLGTAVFKPFFGGLDMRKLRTYATRTGDPSIDGDSAVAGSDAEARIFFSANHLLSAGDSISVNAGTAAFDGTYIIKESATASDVDVYNAQTGDDNTDSIPITTNQWESVILSSTSDLRMGELRCGFSFWDKGNIASNVIRYDKDTAQFTEQYMNSLEEAAVRITTSSAGDEDNDYFQNNTFYYYKISLIYDGYQEGPLSNANWKWIDANNKTRSRLNIDIRLKNPSRRLTHVCLYRKDNVNDYYKLVEQADTESGWSNLGGDEYKRSFSDDGILQASYEARSGLSELIDTIKVKYGISVEIDGFLFVGDCSHEKIKNASNMIFRSKPGRFSVFDYVNDFQTIKSKPTAMVNFNGRLYAFDESNIYKINQHTLTIEDVYEGVGCLSQDSIIVTEYGLFFADKNGAYMHDGNTPVKISEAIHRGGDLTKFESIGTNNIYDVSWSNTVGNPNYRPPYVTFDSDTGSVLFVIDFTGGKEFVEAVASFKKSFIWSFNITNKRWDLWELSDNEHIGKPLLGQTGEVLIPIGSCIYENRGGATKKDFTWISNKLTMGTDSVVKVFNKVKVNGVVDDLSSGGVYNESSDRLLLATSSGDISTANVTYSSSAAGYSSYRVSGSNKKGRWMQVKLEDMSKPVDSLGIIFRRKAIK